MMKLFSIRGINSDLFTCYYSGSLTLFLFLMMTTLPVSAQDLNEEYDIESVTIYPVFNQDFVSREHASGTEMALGDKLGRDFIIMGFSEAGVPSVYENDGSENEDWYGWREDVLAPIDGEVIRVQVNDVTNSPGQIGEPPASGIVFERKDGVKVLYAHVREIKVEEGDHVESGDVVAKVGNDGISFSPHIHVGAWKDEQPLQIQVDLEKMGEVVEPPEVPEQ